jgi:hypothetical protein
LTNLEFVGPNTPHPGKTVIPNDLNNFAPNVGFAYQAPWLGERGLTIRGGYGITFGSAGRNGIAIDTLLGSAPGNVLTAGTPITDTNIQNVLATRALNLTDLPILVPVTPSRAPGATVPIYQRSVAFTAYDPNFQTPYTQNLALSVTRQVSRKITLDIRWVGTLARKQSGDLNLNESTVFYNPELLDALTVSRAGGNSPLLDQMFAGLNVAGVTTDGARTYGPVGTCVVQPATPSGGTPAPGLGLEGCASNAVMQHGSAHLRRSTQAGNLANGNFEAVANGIVTLNPTGLQTGPTGVTAVTQRALRNGCDRIANGFGFVEQSAVGVFVPGYNASNARPLRCFPENYLQTNPQFSTATYTANIGHTNYHSLQVQSTIRPSNGMSLQATYSWAKSMELLSANGFGDPLMRDLDYQRGRQGPHSFRMNGTVELPMGPNKLLFGNASGVFARLIERWQTSFILNLATGSPADILGAGTMRYGAARMNTTPYWKIPSGSVTWDRQTSASVRAGNWYGNPSPYISVRDPQCADTGYVSQFDSMGLNLSTSCSLDALGLKVPTGTPDSQVINNTSYVLALVNPTPGNFGNLGPRTLNYWGQFSLDANASKTFRLTESKSLSVRIDARNVLNHPTPGIPSFSIDTLGDIGTKSGSRTFQAQARLSF